MTKHDVESKRPLHSKRGEHFLNQLGIMSQSNSDLGNNLGADASAAAISGKDESTPVYITLNVRSIRAIDPNEESYQLRCHLYLMWGVDFQRDPEYTPLKKSLHDKALDAEYYSMTTEDVEEMEKHVILPSFRFANAKETSPTDDAPSMRVYATKEKESEDSTSFILWNQGFELTLSTHFPLHDFPFDAQDLFISIRQDDGRSWDKYNLTMAIVQFHKEALEMAEWCVVLFVLFCSFCSFFSFSISSMNKILLYLQAAPLNDLLVFFVFVVVVSWVHLFISSLLSSLALYLFYTNTRTGNCSNLKFLVVPPDTRRHKFFYAFNVNLVFLLSTFVLSLERCAPLD